MTAITRKGQEETEERQKKKEDMRAIFTILLQVLYKAEIKSSRCNWGDIAKHYSGITGLNITLSGEHKEDYSHNIELCLFLWAIKHQRFTVAKELLRQTKNIMAGALLAYKCLQKMKEDNTTAIYDLDRIESMVEYYNKIAKETLTACSRVKNESAKNILVRKRDELGGMSLLQIAKYNMPFIAHDACHSKVNEIWFSPLDQLPSVQQKCLFLVSVLLPFLAPLLLNFRRVNAVPNGTMDCKQNECFKRQSKVTQYGNKVLHFSKAPIVKFAYHLLAFLTFIVFFAYDLTFDVSEFAWNDGIVFAFVVSFITEEIRQAYQEGRHYLRNVWNWIDLSSLILFISGHTLTITTSCSECGRVLLAVSFVMFSIRLLQAFSCLAQMGSFLIMIARMLVDTFYFLGILTVVVISYAVSSRAVLYPNSTFTWASLYTAFRKPYWHLFGELFLEEIEGDAECVAAGTATNSTEFCPSTMAQYVMPVLLGVYMLIVHVLLMNLLIAKFSYTVTSVHKETDIHWRYLRFQLVYEYSKRTLIFPPFSFLYHICLLIHFCAKKMCTPLKEKNMNILSRDYDSFCVIIPQRVNANLQNWEHKRAKKVYDISNDISNNTKAFRPVTGHIKQCLNKSIPKYNVDSTTIDVPYTPSSQAREYLVPLRFP